MTAIVSVKNLSKTYKSGLVALKDVSLDIRSRLAAHFASG